MDKDKYIEIVNEKLTNENSKKIMIDSINKYYYFKDKINILNKYNIGDNVLLPKGTLLHGTYKNLDGLKYIVKNGLICHNFVEAREGTKYPYSVGVWNIKEECLLKDYIDYYSGGTIKFNGFMKDGKQNIDKEIISYSNLNNLTKIINDKNPWFWDIQGTKETRFMPSLIQDNIQIGIIFNGENDEIKEFLRGDILSNYISDDSVKDFILDKYYEQFVIDRKNKDVFFTDRESAILFGIPASFIEGVLVGRQYEKDKKILNEIKELLPNCYICNLDGIVIF